MPEVDVGGKVQVADDYVSVGFVFDTAGQSSQCRCHVGNTGDFFQTSTNHLPEESTGLDDHGKPFFPVLSIIPPVSQVFVDSVENMNWRGSRPRIVEIRPAGGYGDFFSYQVDIQRDTRKVYALA